MRSFTLFIVELLCFMFICLSIKCWGICVLCYYLYMVIVCFSFELGVLIVVMTVALLLLLLVCCLSLVVI